LIVRSFFFLWGGEIDAIDTDGGGPKSLISSVCQLLNQDLGVSARVQGKWQCRATAVAPFGRIELSVSGRLEAPGKGKNRNGESSPEAAS
jgi:hypothetical protein